MGVQQITARIAEIRHTEQADQLALTLSVRVVSVVSVGSVVSVMEVHADLPGEAVPAAPAAASECDQLVAQRVRLSWYLPKGATVPQPGSHHRLLVKLKHPWGMRNVGGFDYQRWLLANGYAATGYVRQHMGRLHSGSTARRVSVANLSNELGLQLKHAPLLDAAVLGHRGGVSNQTWSLLRQTGTVHLMVVSGLHIATLAGLVFAVFGSALRLLPYGLHQPCCAPRQLAALMAVMVIVAYVWMAGAQPPLIRACVMASFATLVLGIGGRAMWWSSLAMAALVTLILSPGSIALSGWYLSFGAVASLLFFFAQRARTFTPVAASLVGQWVLLLGVSPLLAGLVQLVPVLSLGANLLIIPIITL